MTDAEIKQMKRRATAIDESSEHFRGAEMDKKKGLTSHKLQIIMKKLRYTPII